MADPLTEGVAHGHPMSWVVALSEGDLGQPPLLLGAGSFLFFFAVFVFILERYNCIFTSIFVTYLTEKVMGLEFRMDLNLSLKYIKLIMES